MNKEVIIDIENPKDNDLISRQAVLDELNKWDWQELYLPIHFKENIIDVVPSVKPQEPKAGHWFAWKPEDDVWRTTCSECGEETRTLWNYCPNCGCRMVEPQEVRDK